MPRCQDTGIFFEIESTQYHEALRMHEEALYVVGHGFKHNFVVNSISYRDNGNALPVAVPLKVAGTTLKETLRSTKQPTLGKKRRVVEVGQEQQTFACIRLLFTMHITTRCAANDAGTHQEGLDTPFFEVSHEQLSQEEGSMAAALEKQSDLIHWERGRR